MGSVLTVRYDHAAAEAAKASSYVWDGQQLLQDSVNAYIYTTSTSTPSEQVSLATGAITYLSTDLIGSVRGTVNSAGSLTATTSYDAWGNPQTTGGLTATMNHGQAACRRSSGYRGPRRESPRVFVAHSRLGDVRRLPVPACRGKRQGVAQASPPAQCLEEVQADSRSTSSSPRAVRLTHTLVPDVSRVIRPAAASWWRW